MHSSKPAKTVYSPPNGFFRKNKSNLKHYIKWKQDIKVQEASYIEDKILKKNQ